MVELPSSACEIRGQIVHDSCCSMPVSRSCRRLARVADLDAALVARTSSSLPCARSSILSRHSLLHLFTLRCTGHNVVVCYGTRKSR